MDIDINSFVDTLVSESRSLQAERKEQAGKPGRPDYAANTGQIVSITLVKTERECICCGAVYESPEALLMEYKDRKGSRYDPYASSACVDIAFSHLPKRIITQRERVPACHLCFDLTSIIEEAMKHPASAQYSLPLDPPKVRTIPLGGKAKAGKHGVLIDLEGLFNEK